VRLLWLLPLAAARVNTNHVAQNESAMKAATSFVLIESVMVFNCKLNELMNYSQLGKYQAMAKCHWSQR
jgi:hypothetical protein